MAVQDECTLRIIGRYQNQNIVNTMHYRITVQTDTDLDILDQLCAGWNADHNASWIAAHIDDYTLVGLKAFGKTGTSKTPGVLAVGDIGGVTGDGATAFVCRTITLYTADTKHRRRGRLMLSGTPQAHIDAGDGSVTAAGLTILGALGAGIIDTLDFGGNEWEPGIPATAVDPWQDFVDYKARETPSSVTSRRIREFLIG